MIEQKEITPKDTRYIALTQQNYCCVPTCIQMIMLRHNIPLLQSEELAYYLGLGVTNKERGLLWNPRIIKKLPEGFSLPATHINEPEFEPNKMFKKLNIPLKFSQKLIDEFTDLNIFQDYLDKIKSEDKDFLACFDWEFVNPEEFDDYIGGYGHLCIVDKVLTNNTVRMVDPEHGYPKWPIVSVDLLFNAMKSHGVKRGGGFWELEYIGDKK